MKKNKVMPQVINVRPTSHGGNNDISFKPSFFQQQNNCTCQCQAKKTDKNDNEKVESQESIPNMFKEFAESTTAHGFGSLIAAESKFHRFVWVIVMIAAFTILFLIIQPLFQKYFFRPVASKETVQEEKSPVYPVLVLCNENMVRREKFHHFLASINETDESIEPWEALLGTSKRRDYGHKINDTITQCTIHKDFNHCLPTYDEKENGKKGWIDFWHWKYGSCWAYNTGFDHEGNPVPLKKSKQTGARDGLRLHLNIQQEDYMEHTESAGIRLLIAEQGSKFSISTDSLVLGPGQAYEAVLQKSYIHRVDPFENGSCAIDSLKVILNHHSKKPIPITKYSRQFCQDLCISTAIAEKCKCVDITQPLPEKYKAFPICSDRTAGQEECVTEMLTKFHKGEIECSCRPACKDLKYSLSITSQSYPTWETRERVKAKGERDPSINNLKLTIYFKSLAFRKVTEHESYQIENLIADLGGQFGLFGGFSVLTFVEFVIFFMFVIYQATRKCFEGKPKDAT